MNFLEVHICGKGTSFAVYLFWFTDSLKFNKWKELHSDTNFYVPFKEFTDILKLEGPWNPDGKLLRAFCK